MKKTILLPLLLLAIHAFNAEAQDVQKAPAETVYTTADVMPEFKGNVQKWLGKNVNYPKAALEAGAEGNVVIKFVIDEEGRVTDPIVERSVHPALDAEALRVIKTMPSWKPATNNGKPVKVYYHMPVKFTMG